MICTLVLGTASQGIAYFISIQFIFKCALLDCWMFHQFNGSCCSRQRGTWRRPGRAGLAARSITGSKIFNENKCGRFSSNTIFTIFRVVNDSDYGGLECLATNSVGSGGAPCQYRIAQPVRRCAMEILKPNYGLV